MNLLAYFRMFHPIDNVAFELLTKNLHSRNFKKSEWIIKPGQIQREILFIKEGVQMSYHDSGSKLHVIAFTYPPNLCAVPESFMLQKPATYYLQCITDTKCDSISFDDLQALFDQSQQIERLFRKMTEAVLAGVINRHVELHALSMEERFRVFTQRSSQLLQLVPHKYIASYLGIDPTNFSKLYNSIKI
jgi:CRP-like cAMP-binding protein